MKNNSTILFTVLVTMAFITAITGIESVTDDTQNNFNTASVLGWNTPKDTSDMTIDDYKDEIANLKEEIKELKKDNFKFHFESDDFKEEMKNLAIELDKIKDIDIHFDMEEFNDEMLGLSEELKNLNLDIKFDSEKFKDEMKELRANLKNHPIIAGDFDFDIDLDLEHLSIDLGNLKVELKKLESFLKELKSEMKNDGLIDNVEDDVNIEFDKDEMRIDGEKVPDDLYQKYIDIYERHFDKSIEDGFSIHSH